MVRKEAKGHGAGNQVEGRFGLRWVEGHHDRGHCHDGWESLKAINAVEAAGLNVVQVLCVVIAARERPRSEAAGYTLEAL